MIQLLEKKKKYTELKKKKSCRRHPQMILKPESLSPLYQSATGHKPQTLTGAKFVIFACEINQTYAIKLFVKSMLI